VVGKFYVKSNGSSIRLVDAQDIDGSLQWYDFDPDTGEPMGSNTCSREALAR
jgi:hypothetical protein